MHHNVYHPCNFYEFSSQVENVLFIQFLRFSIFFGFNLSFLYFILISSFLFCLSLLVYKLLLSPLNISTFFSFFSFRSPIIIILALKKKLSHLLSYFFLLFLAFTLTRSVPFPFKLLTNKNALFRFWRDTKLLK